MGDEAGQRIVTWWCAATRLPWSWSPRAYPGVWAFVIVLAVGGWAVNRRVGVPLTGRRRLAWGLGLASLWLATDWPLGTLGSGYLASAHMVQFMIYTFVAAPLLLLAVPEGLAERIRPWSRTHRVGTVASRPLVAALVSNAVLVLTHAPWTVDTLRVTQAGSFVRDVVWLLGGLVLWAPIVSPIRAHRARPLVQGAYLFLAAGLVPMVPGAFLTFADEPLYRLYELAPRVGSIDPTSDQQAAGVLMKVGNIPLVWPVIAAIVVGAARRDEDLEPRRPVGTTQTT